MKRLLSAAFALVMVLALVLTGAPKSPVAAARADKTLEIYVAGATQGTLDWFNNTAFPAFEKDNPGVKCSIITGDWGTFDTMVAGWIQTGDGPDIVYLGSEYAATYGKLLADLDPYLKDWPDLKNFLPAALDTATYDGHLRGLPILMSPRPIFYRADLTSDPAAFKAPLTFADALAFVKANSEVKDGAMVKMGYMDIGGGLFDAQEFIGLIWSAGGELYNADGTSAFDSKATAEALQYMYDRRRVMMPTEDTAGLPAFQGTPLASNEVVSGIFPMWNVPATSDPIWKNVVMAPYPAGPDGKPLIQVFIDWLSVPSYAKDPELAATFLKFIGSKDNAIALQKVAGYTPVRTDAWEDLKASDPVWSQLIDLTSQYGRAFADIRASAELRPLITQEVTLFLTDQEDLATCQQHLKEQYDAILKANGYIQ